MKRPDKYSGTLSDSKLTEFEYGYNQACEDWEAFMPSEEEILNMIWKAQNLNDICKASESIFKALHDRLSK